MLKKIILMAALMPACASAHDWDQDYWLERILRNHVKIGDCYQNVIIDNDIDAFRKNCSVHSMGYTENKILDQYNSARLHHPLLSDKEFIAQHFSKYNEASQNRILDNVHVINTSARSAIITMYILEGITRNDK